MSDASKTKAQGSDFLTFETLIDDETVTVYVSREALRDRDGGSWSEADHDDILRRHVDAVEAIASVKVRSGEQEDDGSVYVFGEDFQIHRAALR